MSTKRTSDEETTERSDAVFDQLENAKRTRLVPPSDTTLQDLPIELLQDILITSIIMEVKSMKLAKSVWIEKADLAMRRLGTVCSYWSDILRTDYFRTKIHAILEGTAQGPMRLEELRQLNSYSMGASAMYVTTLKDELFVIWGNYNQADAYIYIFDSTMSGMWSDYIPLPGRNPLGLAACGISNCLYLLSNDDTHFKGSVVRIVKGDDNIFTMSELISDLWLLLPNPTLTVTSNGDLILSRQRRKDRVLLTIYDAAGSLQHEVRLSTAITGVCQIISKANGSLVLVSREKDVNVTKLIEIDLQGTVLRQYLLHSTHGVLIASDSDSAGRVLITEELTYRCWLLDSEFNMLEFAGLGLDEYSMRFLYKAHCNRERNEIVCFFITMSCHPIVVYRLAEEASERY